MAYSFDVGDIGNDCLNSKMCLLIVFPGWGLHIFIKYFLVLTPSLVLKSPLEISAEILADTKILM